MPREKTITVYTFKELREASEKGEVPKKSYEKALERARENACSDEGWFETIQDEWKEALDQIGFREAEIAFSGFSSQGDGASFTGKVDATRLIDFLSRDIEPKKSIDPVPDGQEVFGHKEDFRPWLVGKNGKPKANEKHKQLLPVFEAGEAELTLTRRDHRYSHYNTVSTDMLVHGGDILDSAFDTMKDDPEELLEDLQDDVENLRGNLCNAIYRDLEAQFEYLTSDEALEEDTEMNDWEFDKYGRRVLD